MKSGDFAASLSIHEGHVIETRHPIKIDENSTDSKFDLESIKKRTHLGRSVATTNRASVLAPARRQN